MGVIVYYKTVAIVETILDVVRNTIFTTQELENEIRTVLLRKKFRKYVDVRAVEIFIYQISRYCEKIEIDGKCADVNIRDPKDIYLVTLSEETKADYLVSGDKDLLVIGEYKVTKFITLSEFKAIFFNK